MKAKKRLDLYAFHVQASRYSIRVAIEDHAHRMTPCQAGATLCACPDESDGEPWPHSIGTYILLIPYALAGRLIEAQTALQYDGSLGCRLSVNSHIRLTPSVLGSLEHIACSSMMWLFDTVPTIGSGVSWLSSWKCYSMVDYAPCSAYFEELSQCTVEGNEASICEDGWSGDQDWCILLRLCARCQLQPFAHCSMLPSNLSSEASAILRALEVHHNPQQTYFPRSANRPWTPGSTLSRMTYFGRLELPYFALTSDLVEAHTARSEAMLLFCCVLRRRLLYRQDSLFALRSISKKMSFALVSARVLASSYEI
nr:hypothetical protein CFP56_36292 [Quercus suber]